MHVIVVFEPRYRSIPSGYPPRTESLAFKIAERIGLLELDRRGSRTSEVGNKPRALSRACSASAREQAAFSFSIRYRMGPLRGTPILVNRKVKAERPVLVPSQVKALRCSCQIQCPFMITSPGGLTEGLNLELNLPIHSVIAFPSPFP